MKDFWAQEASSILKSMLERESISYRELSRRLEKIGCSEDEVVLRNKINRGTFQFQFFIQCMVALGSQSVEFKVRPEPIEVA